MPNQIDGKLLTERQQQQLEESVVFNGRCNSGVDSCRFVDGAIIYFFLPSNY